MANNAIEIRNLGKQYRRREVGKGRYKTLRESLTSAWWKKQPNGKEDFFWALRHVHLEIPKGEIVGVIGPNGAGKSTLLKLLTRVTAPTEGSFTLRGRVASLLEVGTGFHPELTGRENIFLSGAIMGMKREEIKRKFDEIVAFSGVEQFLDLPVKRYSSGMFVRLGFAVAAHLETEILLVDEVLAVGDAEFQKKCLGKMGDVAQNGRTVLFVSHNLGAVGQLCSKSLLLYNDERYFGYSDDIISNYKSFFEDLTKLDSKKIKLKSVDKKGNLFTFNFKSMSIEDSLLLSISLENRFGDKIFVSEKEINPNSNLTAHFSLKTLLPSVYYLTLKLKHSKSREIIEKYPRIYKLSHEVIIQEKYSSYDCSTLGILIDPVLWK